VFVSYFLFLVSVLPVHLRSLFSDWYRTVPSYSFLLPSFPIPLQALKSKHLLQYGPQQNRLPLVHRHAVGTDALRAFVAKNGRYLHTSTPLHLSHDALRHVSADDDEKEEQRRQFAQSWGMKYNSKGDSYAVRAQQEAQSVQCIPMPVERVDEAMDQVRASMEKLGVSLTYAVETELRQLAQNGSFTQLAHSIYKAAGFERFEDPKYHERKGTEAGKDDEYNQQEPPEPNKKDDEVRLSLPHFVYVVLFLLEEWK
jgi:hypothetical protein